MNTNQRTGLTRRDFLKSSALLGGCSILAAQASILGMPYPSDAATSEDTSHYPLAQPENIIYTTCLQCTTACMVKVKLLNGVVMKIDGNPYSATNLLPNLPYTLTPWEVSQVDGKSCCKGQAGIQTTYDPYRLRKVLKRVGSRGSGKWKTVPFDQAVQEIVHGGQLFKEIGEERHIQGINDVAVLRDTKLMSSMAKDVESIRQKKMTVQEFKSKYQDNLHYLIDPEHPDLGPKNNQFLFQVGRIHNGRTEFTQRFVKNALGSINWIEKTSICGQTSNKAWVASTNAFKEGKWTGGAKTLRPDWANTEFVLVVGTRVLEANYGPVQEAEPITDGLVSGRLKLAVVDPQLSKVASKAWKWLPSKPGTDGAFGLGLIRWILENNRFDQKYLENANLAAAKADKETTWSDSTYLVKIVNGRPEKYLRANEVNLGTEKQFVVYSQGNFVAVDPNSTQKGIEGELLVTTQLNGITLKSSLQLLKEEAFSRTLEDYAAITGVAVQDIIDVAKEFTSHGKKAAVEFYRGAIKHTNGWYNAQALIALNFLIGNPNWEGGLAKPAGGWDYIGSSGHNKPYNMNQLHPGKLSSFGVPITREGWQYEESTLFKGYPAQRPWYPFSGNVAQETWPSISDAYPYSMKVVLLHSHNPMYSLPGGSHQLKTLLDTKNVPLLIASDIVIGETSMYADYIFPDISYLEQWGAGQMPQHYRVKTSSVRQPVIAPLTETVVVNGEKLPICLETLMLAIASEMGLSGFGQDGFGKDVALKRPEDWYLKLAANIAYGDQEGEVVADAAQKELSLFQESRRYLSDSFSEEKWKNAVKPQEWRKVVYVLNRGGRFESSDHAYSSNQEKYPFTGIMRFYLEEIGTSRHAMSGQYFNGHAVHEDIKDCLGHPVPVDGDYKLITFKEVFGTQSRTIADYWLETDIANQNFVLLNSQDAKQLGIKNGDNVRLSSQSNLQGVQDLGNNKSRYVEGAVKVKEGIRPGVVAVSTHYGHWAYGATDVEIDGVMIRGDSRRGKGIHVNPIFRLDDNLRGTPLSEPIGGSVSFYDTWVKVVKA